MGLEQNLDNVKACIIQAAERVNRNPKDITLVAVTKKHPIETMQSLIDLGVTDIGENKAQEVRDKYSLLQRDVAWHFIGHLQKNKIKYIIDKVAMIHSVDQYDLAAEISRQAKLINRVVPVLIEVNVSGESSKFGLHPQEVEPLLKELMSLPGIEPLGLMTMAPHEADPEMTRPVFRGLNKLFNEMVDHGFKLTILSMGMSNDYSIAIEEGATHVRVGSAILGERPVK